ncbi:MAG: hypothetical protein CSB55_02170 [Candidatus Cloacimonadota bacterium]|nr:MAG: hypothetical protein CSB55_02170 [Candidatus Cloacimonadota bacterium]
MIDFLRKLHSCVKDLFFAKMNSDCIKEFALKPIKETRLKDDFYVIPFDKKYSETLDFIYALLSSEKELSGRNKKMTESSGEYLVFLLADKAENKIAGAEFYYFNERDKKEKTVHQGFRGILPEYQGKGLGTCLTKFACSAFSESKLCGVSSRVSRNNPASFYSNKKAGFEVTEKYFDPKINEERYYMKNIFKRQK